MNIRSEIYKELKAEIKAKMPDLQYIDLQKRQFEKADQNYPIPLPACLVEFKPVTWSNTIGEQIGDAIICLHLYVDIVTDSFDGSEAEDDTINILDNQDNLHDTMQGFSGTHFAPLNRSYDNPPQYGIRYICYPVDFKTVITCPADQIITTAERPEPKFKFN